jgi:RNA polymerase sigma factor (TIGR02999 family)
LATPDYARPVDDSSVIEDPPLTEWIQRAVQGEPGAFDRVFSRLYPELRRIAHARLFAAGTSGSSLSTTELVHESFLRFVRTPGLALADRRHFFTYAATVMRHVIVDLAREHWAQRRGGGAAHLPLDELPPGEEPLAGGDAAHDELLLRIHDALDELERLDPPLARIVEMQYFAGYSQLEIAGLIDASERTVRRQWDKARAFLLDRLRA